MLSILTKAEENFQEVVELAKSDIGSVRVGRAKPSMVQDIKVEAYGSVMQVKELGAISAPDSQTIVIKPWDNSVLPNLQKGIMQSSAGLNPVVDGNIIRINIPPLTGEQRQNFAKLVDQKAESAKVMLRQVRSGSKEEIETKKGQAGVSEDNIHETLEKLQLLTDKYANMIDGIASEQRKELLTL